MNLDANQVADMFVTMIRGAPDERIREALTVVLRKVHSAGHRAAIATARTRLDDSRPEGVTAEDRWSFVELDAILN